VLRFDHVIRDPVHRDIPLTTEELRVLDTAEIQRLRSVRQLGAAYMVYPGAQHTRFEHSVGSAHLALNMAEAANGVRDTHGASFGGYDEQEIRVIRIAALIHDCTHLPFGHNIEDQVGLLPRHDIPERFAGVVNKGTELGRVLSDLGVREEVLAILSPQAAPGGPPPAHWTALISGTIDADMLDYLARDAHFTGLRLNYDPRILRMFRVDRRSQQLFADLGSRGYLKESVLSEIIRCLEARYYFSERVYNHHAKIAAELLVAKALESALEEGALDLATIQRSTDAGLLDTLENISLRDAERRANLATCLSSLRSRRLPKRAAVFPVYANEDIQHQLIEKYYGGNRSSERSEAESKLSEAASRAIGRPVPVFVYCPAPTMQVKQAKMLVQWPGETDLYPLSHFSERTPRLADLEESYMRMWKFFVFALTDSEEALEAVREACLDVFPGAVNLLQSGAEDSANRPG